MKKLSILTIAVLMSVFLFSCGDTNNGNNNNEVKTDNVPDEQVEEEQTTSEDLPMSETDKIIAKNEISKDFKATITKKGIIWMEISKTNDYRIIGYQNPNTGSQKMILMSSFTNEVEDNPFGCKYGSYYDSGFMEDSGFLLMYKSDEGEFIKVTLLKDDVETDELFMEKRLFETDK